METQNLFQWILFRFELHIDDLSAKPLQPTLCIAALVSLTIYCIVSICSLWYNNDGTMIVLILNLLCVLKGFCKVNFNQELYRMKIRDAWDNCTAEHEKFLKAVCKPYNKIFFLELITLIMFIPTLIVFVLTPNSLVPTKALGSAALAIAFIGDSLDVLTDMYRAHPPLPPPMSP